MHEKFTIYRNSSGWNERAILVNELKTLNNEMKKKNRKICLIIDKAPCHLLGKNPLPDLSNLTLVYIEKKMTDKLQENFINYLLFYYNIILYYDYYTNYLLFYRIKSP